MNANIRILLFTMLLSTGSALGAAELAWHGFMAQGVSRSQHSGFINNSGDWSAELTELGLNGHLSISPALRLAGQLVYLDGGNRYPSGLRVDYLFVDWTAYSSLDWQLNLYAGRYKNQHWLYSSTRDVPFTRPSIVLPQSVYFDAFRDVAVSSDGAALRAHSGSEAGDFTFNWSYGTTPISYKQSQLLLGYQTQGETELQYDHQMSLYWQSVSGSLSTGIVLLDSAFDYSAKPAEPLSDARFGVQRVMLNMRYQTEHWELVSELMQERVNAAGFFAPQFRQNSFAQGGYLMLQYRIKPTLRSFALLDYFVVNKDDRWGKAFSAGTGGTVPDYFGYQHSLALGGSADLAANWRISAEVHWVRGTGRLAPVIMPDMQHNTREYWQLLALQLMYRF